MKEVFTKLEITKKIRLDAFQYAPSHTGPSLERDHAACWHLFKQVLHFLPIAKLSLSTVINTM